MLLHFAWTSNSKIKYLNPFYEISLKFVQSLVNLNRKQNTKIGSVFSEFCFTQESVILTSTFKSEKQVLVFKATIMLKIFRIWGLKYLLSVLRILEICTMEIFCKNN